MRLDGRAVAAARRRTAILAYALGGGVGRIALHLAHGLFERGHAVDLLLVGLRCDYPTDLPEGVGFFWVPQAPDPLLPARRSSPDASPLLAAAPVPEAKAWRVRRPRLALAPVLRRRQAAMVLRNAWLARSAVRIAAYLDRERPDAVLALNDDMALRASMGRRLARRPVRVAGTLHNALVCEERVRRARASYPFLDAAATVSHGVSNQLAGLTGIPRTSIRTIHDPVVSTELLRRADEPVDHPWLGGEQPVILAAARLHPQKDYPTLLRALARLLPRRRVRLIVLGRGELLPDLREETRTLGIAGAVDFAGFKENPFAFMAKADLFVLSSAWEGLPGVLIQALAVGCPIVSTDCPHGPAEILEDGRLGALVPVGDPAALAAAIDRALDAPRRPGELRARAADFGVARAVDAYERLLLDDRATPGTVRDPREPADLSPGPQPPFVVNVPRNRTGRGPTRGAPKPGRR